MAAQQTLSARRRVLAVLAGGFLGTLARYFLSLTIQGWFRDWPYDILAINLTGALLLAFVNTLADATFLVGPTRRLLINTGFMGAYTTFSSLALGDILLFSKGAWFPALLYVTLSLVGGICAVLLGNWLGQMMLTRFHHGKGRPHLPPVGVSSKTHIGLQDDLLLADRSDGFESPIH
jgi:CrcB protein